MGGRAREWVGEAGWGLGRQGRKGYQDDLGGVLVQHAAARALHAASAQEVRSCCPPVPPALTHSGLGSPPPITSNLASPALASQVDPARRLPAVHPDVGLLGASANPITRRAGGRLGGRAAPRRIVVDVREFMSSLPAVLHQQARRWALGGPGRGGAGRAAVAVHGGLAGVGRQSTVSELSSSSRVLIRCFRVGAGAHHM